MRRSSPAAIPKPQHTEQLKSCADRTGYRAEVKPPQGDISHYITDPIGRKGVAGAPDAVI